MSAVALAWLIAGTGLVIVFGLEYLVGRRRHQRRRHQRRPPVVGWDFGFDEATPPAHPNCRCVVAVDDRGLPDKLRKGGQEAVDRYARRAAELLEREIMERLEGQRLEDLELVVEPGVFANRVRIRSLFDEPTEAEVNEVLRKLERLPPR